MSADDPSVATATAYDTDAVQRRTLRVLWFSSVFSRGATSSIFPVSVLAIKELLGSDRFAGSAAAATTVGSAISAAVLAGYMQRRGRNPGLTAGLAAAVFGAVIGIVAIQVEVLPLFIVAMVLVGVGSGASNLSRYAAADLASTERRSRDISSVIFASTLGAVVFPLFIGVAGDVAVEMGLDENAGGFAMGAGFFLISAAAIWVFMRPDPLVVAGGVSTRAEVKRDAVPFRQAVAIAWRHPLARLAFIAIVVAQGVMVMVMAMTPLHMKEHGHGTGVVGQVISAHTAGMFALAPLAGWMSDRYGRVRILVLSAITLGLATALTALAGEAPKLLMFPGLFLLGLGWNFGIVAGSALLTESVDARDRVAVQGAADSAMNIAGGVGALASGIVLDMAGFHILSMIGMAGAAGLLAQSWVETRLAAPREPVGSRGATPE